MAHGGGKRCQMEHCFQLVTRGSVYCRPCLQIAQTPTTQQAEVEEGGPPPQSNAGPAAAAGDSRSTASWGSCSTVAWEEPGEEVMQAL